MNQRKIIISTLYSLLQISGLKAGSYQGPGYRRPFVESLPKKRDLSPQAAQSDHLQISSNASSQEIGNFISKLGSSASWKEIAALVIEFDMDLQFFKDNCRTPEKMIKLFEQGLGYKLRNFYARAIINKLFNEKHLVGPRKN